jgi:uroporphyrinogen decarboxylase
MRILKTIHGDTSERPIWFMRQAGRYLPEYRALRETTTDFISYCLDSDKASEATLQPITRYGFDAAIIFSDILMIPWAMDRNVRFKTGIGPLLDPLPSPDALAHLDPQVIMSRLLPVAEAVRKTRDQLDRDKALIGFCGAPWTVSTYMIEGGSSRDFSLARKWLWQDPKSYDALITALVDRSVDLLVMKAKAGADILMIFDSWAGVVPSYLRNRFILEPVARIIAGVRANGINQPIIAFPKGLSDGFDDYVHVTGCNVLAVDHTVSAEWLDVHLPRDVAVQGNLDPLAVETGGDAMLASAVAICSAFARRPHIFNLGHGIGQFTPLDHVDQLMRHLRQNRKETA